MKYLHTMIRVNNLDESLDFYLGKLGMNLVSKRDYPEGEFTLAFISFGSTMDDPCIELTYNYGRSSYQIGDGFGHIAFLTPDIYAECERLKKLGVKVTREPGPMKNSTSVIAFIEDPNGYKIEFIQRR